MSDRLLVTTRKGLFTVTRGDAGWSVCDVAFLADNCTLAMRDPRDGTIYAALDHGHFGCKLHRSDDDGGRWEEIGVPTYPERPADWQPSQRPAEGEPAPWTLKLIWALQPGGADEAGVIWCGTLPGGLFRTTDRGDSWTLVESLWLDPKRDEWFGGGADYPGIHSICVHPDDARRIAIGISCGGVWHTADGGATWRHHEGGMRAEFMPPERQMEPNVQDPHMLVQCREHPDRMWVQHHNGIFRSDDGGMNWTEIHDVKPSTFGFAVAVHPGDPDTAWFIPAQKDEHRIPVDGRVVVNRTRDGGRSFDTLCNGLPQEHAYDLVFRHALDVDASGDRLAFGSTTGSLWITEDGGDRWETITSNLPPVYSVSFT
jgi:photosystem II stability/assembly factor-like uncharacterized protein